MGERLLSAQEVAILINRFPTTISMWYRWKRENPEHELAQLLPDYIQEHPRSKRLWKESDVYKLLEFEKNIVKGRKGLMGSVTQRYQKKGDK